MATLSHLAMMSPFVFSGRMIHLTSIRQLLPQPATYFPIRNGRYDTNPNLFRLGTDFGNGITDKRLFQLDSEFDTFRANKMACRAERYSKYVCVDDFSPAVEQAVISLIRQLLTQAYPVWFESIPRSDGTLEFHCGLTGDRLLFDQQDGLVQREDAVYTGPWDALCCQIQEDVAVVRRSSNRGDWIAALHLCAPSHWAAEEKIGRNWSATHEPVPGMEKLRTAAAAIVTTIIDQPPTVRFTWGIEFDTRLNRHPQPPPDVAVQEWNARVPHIGASESLYLRTERQVMWGLPEHDAALFTIRIHHTPLSALRTNREHLAALRSALLAMSPSSQVYKSVEACLPAVITLLDQ